MSTYYLVNKSYLIFKNNNFSISIPSSIVSKYKDVFADGTFYIASIFANQVFITRTFVNEL